MRSGGMSTGLQRRLLVLLLIPLAVLAVLNAWLDYQSADSAAIQQDRQLLALVPLLADSVVVGAGGSEPLPVLLAAPQIEEFLGSRPGVSGIAVSPVGAGVLIGSAWLDGPTPATREPAFSSEEYEGVIYRIVSQRVSTAAGDMVIRLADGSDPRQQWLRLLVYKVIVPNLVLAIAGFFGVRWAVDTALRPLLSVRDEVERRSPRDLSALDVTNAPDEVRPLLNSINHLLATVNAQAQGQARFVADAAHQLRTPLAALQAQAEAWAQAVEAQGPEGMHGSAAVSAPPPTLRIDAQQVLSLRQAARRTSQLANQLLALSRVDAQQSHGQATQRISLLQLCEAVLEGALDKAMHRSIDLGLDALPVHISGHEWLLRELLVNLVDNALKYTPSHGHVTIRCGWDTQAFLEVEDNGPGVPPDERARVIQRFHRAHHGPVDGHGLGLSIADEIARIHGTTLYLATGTGAVGLRIGLRFPAA